MEKEISITGGNRIPCLHCGELVDMSEDMHLCNAKKFEFLDSMSDALMIMPNGDVFDMKANKIVSSSENITKKSEAKVKAKKSLFNIYLSKKIRRWKNE